MLQAIGRTIVVIAFAVGIGSGIYGAVVALGSAGPRERDDARTSVSSDDHGDRRHGRRGDGGDARERGDRDAVSLGHGVAGATGTAIQLVALGAVVVGALRCTRRRQAR